MVIGPRERKQIGEVRITEELEVAFRFVATFWIDDKRNVPDVAAALRILGLPYTRSASVATVIVGTVALHTASLRKKKGPCDDSH